MPEPYALTVAMLEQQRADLTTGPMGLEEREEYLEKTKVDVERLTREIATMKAQVADITRSLELLKAGTSL